MHASGSAGETRGRAQRTTSGTPLQTSPESGPAYARLVHEALRHGSLGSLVEESYGLGGCLIRIRTVLSLTSPARSTRVLGLHDVLGTMWKTPSSALDLSLCLFPQRLGPLGW